VADSTGAVASRQSYDPWGEQLTGPALEFGWLGAQQRRFEPSAGFQQMGIRSYDAGLGRFMSEDPVIGLIPVPASLNRYAYTFGDPLNLYDLGGRSVCEHIGEYLGSACEWYEQGPDLGDFADIYEMVTSARDWWKDFFKENTCQFGIGGGSGLFGSVSVEFGQGGVGVVLGGGFGGGGNVNVGCTPGGSVDSGVDGILGGCAGLFSFHANTEEEGPYTYGGCIGAEAEAGGTITINP
jgi:RHS repeat-associated protein